MSDTTNSRTTANRVAHDGEDGRVIAITGSAGFLGAHLVGLLEESPRVRRIVSLDRVKPQTAGPRTKHYSLNFSSDRLESHLAEILREEKVDLLVHLSFFDGPHHSPAESHAMESVGTMHVLNACRRTRVHRLVHWSQTFLYGASPKNPCYIAEGTSLCARTSEAFLKDKIQAERDVLEFGRPGRGRVATILRTAPIIGPHIDNYVTRYLSQPFVPSVLGFDPLWQFLHESDAVAALKRAIDAGVPGAFNIAGGGVLPLSKVIRLVGRRKMPMTRPLGNLTIGALWVARRSPIPPAMLDYVQYSCVGDTELARRVLGFVPMYTSREAVVDFGATQNLRDVKLISETPA